MVPVFIIQKGILNLNMLKCFKDYKRFIHISYHILVVIQQNKAKFTMEQIYTLPILRCQYHACWCPGDLRSQGISRHCIDQISCNSLSLPSEELIPDLIGSHRSYVKCFQVLCTLTVFSAALLTSHQTYFQAIYTFQHPIFISRLWDLAANPCWGLKFSNHKEIELRTSPCFLLSFSSSSSLTHWSLVKMVDI